MANKKIWVKRSLMVILMFFLLLPSGNALAQRSFGFPSLYIEAEVLPDGSMQVTEQRTASFRGTYSGLYQWIMTRYPIEITDIIVEENGSPYQYNPGTTYGPAGTYYTKKEPNRMYVDWSFNATDETRAFTLKYTVKNVVQVHSDAAELYWQFVGDEWDVSTNNVFVRLLLPPGAAKEDIRAWAHGPLHGEVTIVDGKEVNWTISSLPQSTFLEGRVTFPSELVPQANIKTGKPALTDIIREESEWADQANRQRTMATWLIILAGLILAGSAALAFFIWLRYGKEFKSSFDGDYYRDLPAEYTPAELGVLWRFGKPGSEDLTATILDLARKGYLMLEEYTPEKQGFFSFKKAVDYRITRLEKEDKLADHETKLLKLLFNDISPGEKSVTFSDIEKYAKKAKVRFSKFWQDWQYTLAARGEVLGYFDQNIPTAKAIEIGIGALLVFLGIVARNILSPSLFLGGAILIVAGFALRRRSQQGVDDFARWRAFRRFLLHFSEMERHQIPALVLWEHYLVYAVTLGVAKEVLKQLQIVYPNLESGGHRFGYGWYMHSGHMGASFANMTSSFDSMTESINRSLQAATSTSSSGSGGGGGFSSGGGGGFGGGGGGAR